MSSQPQDTTATSDRREKARARAHQLQVEAEAQARRKRVMLVAAIAAVVFALVVGTVVFVRHRASTTGQVDAAFGPQGVLTIPPPAGSPAASQDAVTVRVYGDFLCPNCRNFEAQVGPWMAAEQKAGRLVQEFVPIAILNGSSAGSAYPSRASSAAYCVATADPSKTGEFVTALYGAQPAEKTPGLTNQQILDVAKKLLPANSTMDACILNARHRAYADKITDQASKDGASVTPTIMVNGKLVDPKTATTFLGMVQSAVKQARGGK